LRQGDLIVAVGGRPVGAPADVVAAVEGSAIGRPLPVTVDRGGARQEVLVIPAELQRLLSR